MRLLRLPELLREARENRYRIVWEDLVRALPMCSFCKAMLSTRMWNEGAAPAYACDARPCRERLGRTWESTPWAVHVTVGALEGVPFCRPGLAGDEEKK
jgi:hypothetical protein